MKAEKLQELLNSMTIEEKIGQMTQLGGYLYEQSKSDVTGPLSDVDAPEHLDATNGSIVGSYGAAMIREIQDSHIQKSRLKIPLLFMADIIHGYRTIFPIPLAMGATWNVDLAEESAEIAARESAASGIHVTFSPMVDLVRDPRWGRVMESTGEDPYLNALFSAAFVKGYQGENLEEDKTRIAACVKHFVAYGLSEGGREYNTVDVSMRELYENYLSGFTAAIEAGVEMVMTSFNPVNGIPVTGNKDLIKGILREDLHFDGVVISDWTSIGELVAHGVADDQKEAAKLALDATVDVDMMSFCYPLGLEPLLEEGSVSLQQLDEAVMRVLKLKNKLGLFEDPYRGLSEVKEAEEVFSEKNRESAQRAAEEAMVLLKNERNCLPIATGKKIALIGPYADKQNVFGKWSWRGEVEEAIQLADALREKVLASQLIVARGSGIYEGDGTLLQEAVGAAEEADVIVLAVGEHADMSGEAASRSTLTLPEAQVELIEEMTKLGKPIALVLFNGRPLDLSGIVDKCDAILETWFLGTQSGEAIAKALLGYVNPSGKLTMSFPQNVGQVPVYYNHYSTGRPLQSGSTEKWVSRYLDVPNEPLFPFGHGLSYTEFEYGDLTLSVTEVSPDTSLTVAVELTNIGGRAGKEVVQLYIQDLKGEVIRPVKELKGFQKVELQPGETKEITFEITETMLRYVHSDLERRSEKGEFKVFVGTSSVNNKEQRMYLVADGSTQKAGRSLQHVIPD